MSNYDWAYPNTVWFGNDRIKELAKACKILGISRPLFVTDKDLVKTKIVEDTLQINKKAYLTTSVFSDLKGNPLGSHVKNGVEIFKKGKNMSDNKEESLHPLKPCLEMYRRGLTKENYSVI